MAIQPCPSLLCQGLQLGWMEAVLYMPHHFASHRLEWEWNLSSTPLDTLAVLILIYGAHCFLRGGEEKKESKFSPALSPLTKCLRSLGEQCLLSAQCYFLQNTHSDQWQILIKISGRMQLICCKSPVNWRNYLKTLPDKILGGGFCYLKGACFLTVNCYLSTDSGSIK